MKDGLLLLNKPVGISSFDCIRQLRQVLLNSSTSLPAGRQGSGLSAHKVLKIGHAGTLDPAASGLMLMLFGSACKQAQNFSKLDKTYVAEITLGATSTTGDREGTITAFRPRPGFESRGSVNEISRPGLDLVLTEFVGTITQVPSVYSAIKIKGQEAYKRARRGEKVDMPSREVTIHELRIMNYEYPKLTLEVSCSSGTYIRSLAADIGDRLETGAYLSALVRTRVGEYLLDQAVGLNADVGMIIDSIKSL